MTDALPLRVLPPHSTAKELKGEFEAMDRFLRTTARGHLSETEQRDLDRLEADMAYMTELRKLAKAGPDTPVERFEKALGVRRELDELREKLEGAVAAYPDREAGLTLFQVGDDTYSEIRWKDPASRALEGCGYREVSCTMQWAVGSRDILLDARPLDSEGRETGHSMRVRVSLPQTGRKNWVGAELSLATPGEFHSVELVPASGDRTDELTNEGADASLPWSRTQKALAHHVLQQLGMGWLTLAECPDCGRHAEPASPEYG
ncbi:MAG: hypothetical protein AB1758_29675 [Candidatus Eremiobacterota bacterium]